MFRSSTTRSGCVSFAIRERLLTVGCEIDHVVPRGERPADRAPDLLFIVHHQDASELHVPASAVGSENANVAPPPGVSSIQISPSMSERKPRQMASPNPVPWRGCRSLNW